MNRDLNLFEGVDRAGVGEEVEVILTMAGLRIERIVSHAAASPPGFWYDQASAEWVVVLAGAAGLQFEGDAHERILQKGDHVFIPPHRRHRVAWTQSGEPTLWLAVHWLS